jgi:ABC-type multidrug transport system fused ATPase/permease subunit
VQGGVIQRGAVQRGAVQGGVIQRGPVQGGGVQGGGKVDRPAGVAPRSVAGVLQVRPRLPYADPGVADVRSPGRFLVWLVRQQLPTMLGGTAFAVIWLGSQAFVPGIVGAGLDAVAAGDVAAVVRWSALLLALGVVQAGAGALRHWFACHNWYAAAVRVQQLAARHAARLGGDLRRQVPTGEVVALTAHDVERYGDLCEVLARVVAAVAAFAVVATLLLRQSLLLGLVVVIGVPLLTALVGPLIRPLEARESVQREQLSRATSLAADTVSGLRVLRGIGGEELYLDRYRTASQQVRAAGVRTVAVRSSLDALRVALPGVFVVLVTWSAARLALDGTITIGALVAFYGYTAFLVLPLTTLAEGAESLASARVAAERLVRVLRTERLHGAPPLVEPRPGTPQQAEDEAYAVPDPGGTLTDPVTGLVVPGGACTAVACADPEDGSALVERLGGYERPAGRLAGVPLDQLPVETARSLVLAEDKDPVLLAGPLAAVFDVPRSGSVGVADALAAASAADVLDAVPGGMSGMLTERARSLSGGQRQRLALARALVVDAPVLVLDEPTSAVDAHTEARIAERLPRLRGGRTTVIVTTSPLLLDRADVVAFVAGGRVVATGTHRRLLRDSPEYRDVVTRGEDEP